MKLKLLAAAALLSLVAPAAGAAPAVFDNGAPFLGAGGNEATGWIQAQDFSFAAETIIGGAGVYLAGFGGIGDWDGSFRYTIFASTGANPGAVLATAGVTPTVTEPGPEWLPGQGNAFLFAFAFAETFTALAGVTYWFAIHAAADFALIDDIYWVGAADNATSFGREQAGGTGDWLSNGQQNAFFLTGPREVVVPEPATLGLLGLGLLGLAFAARARSH